MDGNLNSTQKVAIGQQDINDLIDAEFGQLIADELDNLFTE
jgi:hypothetical protein